MGFSDANAGEPGLGGDHDVGYVVAADGARFDHRDVGRVDEDVAVVVALELPSGARDAKARFLILEEALAAPSASDRSDRLLRGSAGDFGLVVLGGVHVRKVRGFVPGGCTTGKLRICRPGVLSKR